MQLATNESHLQFPIRVRNCRTIAAATILILNILFWILVTIKNNNFTILPFWTLCIISLYESSLALPICGGTFVLLFPIAATILDSSEPANTRFKLFVTIIVLVTVNFFGSVLYMFEGSKKFDILENHTSSTTTYQLVLMDNASCNNPPCQVQYWYRLYQCDSLDISCHIVFESDTFWRWLEDKNKPASLSKSPQNTLQVIVDGNTLYTHNLAP